MIKKLIPLFLPPCLLLLSTPAMAFFVGGGQCNSCGPCGPCDPCAPCAPRCADFGGFYIGANIGYVNDDYQFDDFEALGASAALDDGLPTTSRVERCGFLGGIQAGFNWQPCCSCSLLGFEVDFDGTTARPEARSLNAQIPPAALEVRNQLNWLGTVRARAGVVVGDLLLYLTGGFAYAGSEQRWNFRDTTGLIEKFKTRRHRTGFVSGFGAEWALGCSWSVRAEVLLVHFSQDSKRFTSFIFSPGRSYRFHSHESLTIGRVGLNYRIGCFGC